EKICSVNPDIILNAIAYNDVDACETPEGEELAFKINGEGAGWLGQAASQAGSVIVHFSTDYVFDGGKIEGYVEKEKPRPLSKYGQSKYLGEELLKSNSNRFYLVRTSRLFGKQGGSENSKKNFVDVMLDLAKIKSRLEVVAGEISKPTYALDLAKAVHSLIQRAYPFGVYHIVNEGAASWHDFALKIFEEKLRLENCRLPKMIDSIERQTSGECDLTVMPTVAPVAAEKFPRLAKRPPYSILLNTKFPILRRYEEALADYLAEK
ncbi:MAG: NAD(P)-dependent oxidoreductase, partial [Patescibacteria group bacterium]